MSAWFAFGESIAGYDYRVINEREARASAGIIFLLGLLSLFSVYSFRTLFWAELFSLTFIIEFCIRVFFNPSYAPYMLLGRFFTGTLAPEWVEAKPKRFAWALGLGLGVIMAYYIIFDVISLMRLGICIACLVLLYVEAVFGMCLGCIVYRRLGIGVQQCPGDICTPKPKRFSRVHLVALSAFMIFFILLYFFLEAVRYSDLPIVIIKA